MGHDNFRLKILKKLASIDSFKNRWPFYQKVIQQKLGPEPTGIAIFDLGSHLREIFTNAPVKRGDGSNNQGIVSGAGTAWECLAVWYLNLVFWNTQILATKYWVDYVPETIRDAVAVTIANQIATTETDISVFSVPGHLSDDPSLEEINQIVTNRIKDVDLTSLQTKTNWKDNSQILMLWNIVYSSYNKAGSPIQDVKVGINGVSPESFKNFSYAFLTLPSGKESGFPKANSVSVARVKGLTGGHYWGLESKSGIAYSFKEFFNRNFEDYFELGSIQNHISANLKTNPLLLERFLKLDFE